MNDGELKARIKMLEVRVKELEDKIENLLKYIYT